MDISKQNELWLLKDGADMVKRLGVNKGDSVIDFGCGPGRYTIPLSQVVGPNGVVYAVEKEQEEIKILKERLQAFSPGSQVNIIAGGNLGFAGSISNPPVDAVFVFDVLQHVQDWDPLFKAICSVLKPKGLLHVYPAAVPHPGSVNMDLVISKLKKVGVELETSCKFTMAHNIEIVEDTVYSFIIKKD